MKKTVLSTLLFLIFSCGSDSGSGGRSGGLRSRPFRILTENEKKVLATTTIYYIENFSESDINRCADVLKVNMLDRQGRLLVRVCQKVYDSCSMEGTCVVSIGHQMQMLNFDGKLNGILRFKIITNSECKYGHGAGTDHKKSYKNMCVDPFYSVAADLKIYSLGDVIYFPAVVGLLLPSGEIHDGYFIVRDTGGSIKGHGRFDFFTGFLTFRNLNNPFVKIKFNDSQTFPEYFLTDDNQAELVRKTRNFPLLNR